MQLIKLLQLLAAVLPLVQSAVQAVETMFPAAGQGAQKLDAALELVHGNLAALGASAEQLQQLASPIKATVSSIVSAFNASGLFKHGAPAPAEAPPAA